jgi:hypothetical protein
MKNLAFALAFICLLLASAMFGVPYMTKSSSARSNDLQISQKKLKIWDIPKLLQSHDSNNLQDFRNADKKSSDKSKIRTPKAIVLHSSNNNNNNNDDDNTKSKAAQPKAAQPKAAEVAPAPHVVAPPPPAPTVVAAPASPAAAQAVAVPVAASTNSESNIKGPVKFRFVNSFWTDNTPTGAIAAGATSANVTPSNLDPVAKVEVGPGEGASTLAVMLINQGFSDITAVTGSLDFPSGFKALVTPKNVDSSTSLATYDGVVNAGQTFVLYFPVTVQQNTKVGTEYHGSLKLRYFKLTEQSDKESRSTTLTVPFRLSGKVILDTVSPLSSSSSSPSSLVLIPVQNVVPGSSNVAKIAIRNDGSATATGVAVTVTGIGGSNIGSSAGNNPNNVVSNTNLTQNGLTQQIQQSSTSPIPTVSVGPKTFNIGTIQSNATAQIQPLVFPISSAGGTLQNLNLQISYNDAYGNKKTFNQLVGFQILPTSPQPGLSISPGLNISPSLSQSPPNVGSFSGNPTSVSSLSSFTSDPSTSLQKSPTSISAADTIPIISSIKDRDNDTKNNPVTPTDPPPSSSSQPIRLTAGKVQDLNFTLNGNNIGNSSNSITSLAVSLASQSGAVRILGNSQWNIPSIGPQSRQSLSTKVFASNSLIDTPVFFTITAQYIQNGQQLKTESFNLGAIVIGDIKINANNLAINYIGDTPNLVGSLLNEGNTAASFTSIEMLKQGQQQQLPLNRNSSVRFEPLSPQYIGSLPANSPTAFSIPLKISQLPFIDTTARNNKAVKTTVESRSQPATLLYPVSLKITYTDDLKNNHELVLNKTLILEPTQYQEILQTPAIGENTPESQQQLPAVINGFVDAYWADNTVASSTTNSQNISSASNSGTGSFPVPPQKEVGPGDGQSILAVVLSNTGFSDINGIVGYLSLPPGFSAATISNTGNSRTGMNSDSISSIQSQQQPSIASFNNIVKAGQTYTLYFKVRILNTATVGGHSALLKINYFKVPELQPGQYREQIVTIPFTLPGKVILDTVSKTNDLAPGVSNPTKILLRNKGTADAHSVVVTVTGISGNIISSSNGDSTGLVNANNIGNTSTTLEQQQLASSSSSTPSSSISTVNLGARTFDVGSLPVNGTAEIDPIIYPSYSAGGTLQNLDLQISYTNANGDTKSSDVSVGLRILPTPPEAGLSIGPSQPSPVISPNISNDGNNAGGNRTRPSTVPPTSKNNNDNSGLSISPSAMHYNDGLTHAIYSNIVYNFETVRNTPSTLTSLDTGITPVSTYYKPVSTGQNNNDSTNKSNNNSIILVAGKIENLNFTITNNNNTPITDAVVTLTPQTSSLEILGYSQWTLQSLAPHTNKQFTTQVFGSKSLIGSPVSFLVTVQYISNGQSKTGSFSLGANIVGDIKISINDVALNYIGGVPNLVGSLLNQGNTQALFTTIELVRNPFTSASSLRESSNHSSSASDGRNKAASMQPPALSPSSSSLPPPQYLGDLDADSPLPFSIPLDLVLSNNTSPGVYPVSFKVTYSDDLRNSHEVIIDKTLSFKPPQRHSANESQNFFGLFGGGNSSRTGRGQPPLFGIGIPMLLIIVAIITAAIIFLVMRRRRKPKTPIYDKSDTDIERFIDDSRLFDRNNDAQRD